MEGLGDSTKDGLLYAKGEHQLKTHSEVSNYLQILDRVTDLLNEEVAAGSGPRTFVDLTLLHRVDDYDFRTMPYFEFRDSGDPLRDYFRVNEHLAVLLSIVCNILVIMVFLRVFGLARLPSRIMVSLAVTNLVSAFAQSVHTTSVSVTSLSDNLSACRFITMLVHHCWILQFNCLSSAIVERILACSIPSYYSRAKYILGPAVLISPWAYWTFNVTLTATSFYNIDLGYECSSHLNVLVPHGSISTSSNGAIIITFLLLSGLLLSILLRNQVSGDIWEMNRAQFEMRVTTVALRVTFLTLAFCLPLLLAVPILRLNGITYNAHRSIHIAMQISVHRGLALIIVLTTRPEFRRHLLLTFEPREVILRTRTTNLLLSEGTQRSYSTKLRFGEGSREHSGYGEHPRGHKNSSSTHLAQSQPSTALPYLDQSSMASRERGETLQTPDWLKKKEPEPSYWFMPRVFSWPLGSSEIEKSVDSSL